MISILILTDNICEWEMKIQDSVNVSRELRTSDGYHIENCLFTVDIMSDVTGRERYSHIIVDKPVDRYVDAVVLRPLISTPVIYTKNSVSQ